MTSFADVRGATCQIVSGDAPHGTGFSVLPDGWILTCHHVLYGMDTIMVRFAGTEDVLPAKYVKARSAPERDIAVLHAPDAPRTCVALGRPRTGAPVTGIGFRPAEHSTEPDGHAFTGTLEEGQRLRLRPPKAALDRVRAMPPRPWRTLPGGARTGHVHNFAGGLLVPGISGGPVYDRALRKVVGMFRAVEGREHAYVASVADAFEAWPGLEEENRAAAPEGPLDRLAQYPIELVEENGLLRPVVAHGREEFARLFKQHEAFGGRHEELARLDALLHGDDPCGFVTGPAGYGKTALLATWVRTLEERGVPVAYHFITPQIEAASERFLLDNLCRQLMALHGLGGVLPTEPGGLRPLYADLLRVPPASDDPVVVVIDGLDEAIGRWEPRAARLIPADLPDGVRIVFSARAIADRDWLAELDVQLPAQRTVTLERLSPDEVADVVARAGDIPSPAPDALAPALYALSQGDPFYVQDLLDELRRAQGDPGALADLPIGHSAYLKAWWLDGLKRTQNHGEAFADLLGTLAVARSALTRAQLLAISHDDALTVGTFDLLIEVAARYVDGGDAPGYELRHGRIRQFVADRLGATMAVYRDRLASYCLGWAQPDLSPRAREYMLAHAADHLVEAGREKDLHELLALERAGGRNAWFEAREAEGRVDAYLRDVDVATRAAERSAVGLELEIRYALVRASIASLAGTLPGELLAVLVAHGIWSLPQAAAYARSNPDSERRALAQVALLPMLHEGREAWINEILNAAGRTAPRGTAHALSRLVAHPLDESERQAVVAMVLAQRTPDVQVLRAAAPVMAPADARQAAAPLVAASEYVPSELAARMTPADRRSVAEATLRAARRAREAGDLLDFTLMLGHAFDVEPALRDERLALAAAEAAMDEGWGRATFLSPLLAHVPDADRDRLLRAALDTNDDDALAELARVAPGHVPLIFTAAHNLESGQRARAMVALAPWLAGAHLQQAFADVVDLLDACRSWGGPPRLDIGRMPAASMSPALRDRALPIVLDQPTPYFRALCIAWLAGAVDDVDRPELLRAAIDAVGAEAPGPHRDDAVAALAALMTPDLLLDLVDAARSIGDAHERCEGIHELIRRLPPSERIEGLRLVARMARDVRKRSDFRDLPADRYVEHAIREVVPALAPADHRAAIDLAGELGAADIRVEALADIVPALVDGGLRDEAVRRMQDAVAELEPGRTRAEAYGAMAGVTAGHERAALLARSIADADELALYERVHVVAGIASKVGTGAAYPMLEALVMELLDSDEAEKRLPVLAAVLPADLALHAARTMYAPVDFERERALVALLGRAAELGHARDALVLALTPRAFARESDRVWELDEVTRFKLPRLLEGEALASAVRQLAPHLPLATLGQAERAVAALAPGPERDDALWALRERRAPVEVADDDSATPWQPPTRAELAERLGRHAQSRAGLLEHLYASAELYVQAGGPETTAAVLKAIEDTGRWWP